MPESDSVAVQVTFPTQDQANQTIKQEVIGNTPKSVGQTQSKKRKLSSNSRAPVATTQREACNPVLPPEPSSEPIEARHINIEPITNSEVYKIYCRNDDPKEAMKQIKEMKTCILFEEAWYPLPKEKTLKRCFDDIKEEIFSHGGTGKETKWAQIKKFLDRKSHLPYETVPVQYNYKNLYDGKIEQRQTSVNYNELFTKCFTRIEILLPNGLECWYVGDFESGVGVSKWYRGISFAKFQGDWDLGWQYGDRMALLNVMGVTNSMIEGYFTEASKKKESVRIPWMDFAQSFVESKMAGLDEMADFEYADSFKESKTDITITVTATLLFYYIDEFNDYEKYQGHSTRPMKSTPRTENEKEEMKKEAKKNALKKFFNEKYGINEFNDISIDELQLIGLNFQQ